MVSGETQAKGGGRGGLARRKEKRADAGGKDRVGKIQTREIERGVEARNVWRRRGGRCVRDKDPRSPLSSGLGPRQHEILQQRKKEKSKRIGRKKTSPVRGRREGIVGVVAIARRGDPLARAK